MIIYLSSFTCASVVKQYSFVPDKQWWRSAVGKVTVGLAYTDSWCSERLWRSMNAASSLLGARQISWFVSHLLLSIILRSQQPTIISRLDSALKTFVYWLDFAVTFSNGHSMLFTRKRLSLWFILIQTHITLLSSPTAVIGEMLLFPFFCVSVSPHDISKVDAFAAVGLCTLVSAGSCSLVLLFVVDVFRCRYQKLLLSLCQHILFK